MTAKARSTVILNVNQAPEARDLVSRILREADFEVVEAESGSEALEIAAQERPAVVVLDIRLADISGYEVCRRLKADPATSAVSVIQTSATFVTSEGKARGLDSGADAYLSQPFESVELVAMVRSLRRLRQSESDSRQHAEALAEADRRKDEFLAMLAHELRNPLSAILTATNVLERVADNPVEVRRLGATVARQARHLGRLVDDLLDVSRITSGKIALRRRPVNLCDLAERAAQTVEGAARKQHHEIVVTTHCEPVYIDGDPIRIEQVINNLLTNAIKYTPAGGKITVSVQPNDGHAELRVRDNGMGITPELLPRVFELFTQAERALDRSQGGLGIGLTLVRALVEMHDGHVTVRSDGHGRGSEFVITLPRVPAPQVAAPVRKPSHAPVDGNGKRILVIEDQADARRALQRLLQIWGHEVDVAEDGVRGVDAATAHPPEVALIDVGLPGLDGYEVARRLRAAMGKSIRLVARTGYGQPEDRERAFDAGFDMHLVKPVDRDQLAVALNGATPRSVDAAAV